MEFINLGFIGPRFNSHRGHSRETRKGARLNHAMGNIDWRLRFPEAAVKHLVTLSFDRAPLLLSTDGFANISAKARPFHFQAEWMLHPNFKEFIASKQNRQVSLSNALSSLSSNLMAWNKDVFRNLYKRKKQVRARLEGIQRSLANGPSNGLIKIEKEL